MSSIGFGGGATANAIPERRRLTYALLLSLLIHTWLLSLIFGGQGLLPGFAFPWQERRVEVPDLNVEVVPPQITAAEPVAIPPAEPSQQPSVEQPVASAPTPSASSAPPPRRTAPATVPEARPEAEPNARTGVATRAAPAQEPLRADRTNDTAPPPVSAPAVVALPRANETTEVVPVAPTAPPPVITAAPSVPLAEAPMPPFRNTGDATWARIDEEAEKRVVELLKLDSSRQEEQRRAAQLEAARQEAARQEAARAENAQLEAERQEAARQAADVQDAARQEAARQESARAEAAKIEAARAEAARAEAAKAEAAKAEAAKVEAAKVEAAKVEAAKVEAAKVEAAKAEAAKAEAAQAAAERLEAARRAIGRQLDEEAARREAAARRLPSSSGVRRYRLFGRTDPNAELILYAEAWARKIQLNRTFETVREAAKQPHSDPLVTVAIRSDGSVESVTFVQSSGVAAIDDAIRRVVYSQAPYQVFPPALVSDYDVIEIRRTWYFDVAIRLY